MKNEIIIDGKINGGITKKISKLTGNPYANFSIYVEPGIRPPFYMRCFTSGNVNINILSNINDGQLIRVKGSIESTLLIDGSYGKQINITEISIL